MKIKTFQIVYNDDWMTLTAEELLEDLTIMNGDAVEEVHELNPMKEQEEKENERNQNIETEH